MSREAPNVGETPMGFIADQIAALTASIATSKQRIEDDKARIATLRSECPHATKRVIGNTVRDGGFVDIERKCAECGFTATDTGCGRKYVCVEHQIVLDPLSHADPDVETAIAEALSGYGKWHFYGASVYRCPKCPDLKVFTYWDK